MKLLLLDSEAGRGHPIPTTVLESLITKGMVHCRAVSEIPEFENGRLDLQLGTYDAAVIHYRDDPGGTVGKALVKINTPVVVISGDPDRAAERVAALQSENSAVKSRQLPVSEIWSYLERCCNSADVSLLFDDLLESSIYLLTALYSLQLKWELTKEKPKLFEEPITIGKQTALIYDITARVLRCLVSQKIELQGRGSVRAVLNDFDKAPNIDEYQKVLIKLRDHLLLLAESPRS